MILRQERVHLIVGLLNQTTRNLLARMNSKFIRSVVLLAAGVASTVVFLKVTLCGGNPWHLIPVGGFALVCFGKLSGKHWSDLEKRK